MTRANNEIVVDLLYTAYQKTREAELLVSDAKEMHMVDHLDLNGTIQSLQGDLEQKIRQETAGMPNAASIIKELFG